MDPMQASYNQGFSAWNIQSSLRPWRAYNTDTEGPDRIVSVLPCRCPYYRVKEFRNSGHPLGPSKLSVKPMCMEVTMLLREARLYYFPTLSFICLTYRPTDDGRPKLLRPLPYTITINHEKMATSSVPFSCQILTIRWPKEWNREIILWRVSCWVPLPLKFCSEITSR